MSYSYDTLHGETELPQGLCLISKNNAYYLKIQDDGNLNLYVSAHFVLKNIIWSSKTNGAGIGPYYLRCQNDGNLCLYDGTGVTTWSSKTWNSGLAPYHLTLQNDGNLILFDSKNENVWNTGTSRK